MIWVFGELRKGGLAPSSMEALGAGRVLSDTLKTELNLVIPGKDLCVFRTGEAALLKKADNVYLLEHDLLSVCTNGGCEIALTDFLKDKDVTILIIAGTSAGKDLAPLLAISLGKSCAVNIAGIEVRNGAIYLKRPLYGGRLTETLSLKGSAVITVMPRAFGPAPDTGREGKFIKAEAKISEAGLKIKVREAAAASETRDITEAEVIVAGGRGVGQPEKFKLLHELASVLGGSVAASRAAVDAGWMPHTMQVGQTGKTVSPKLYIACGISGAPQHIAGMRTSSYIMAINKDPNAPIFKESDLGLTGDLFEVIPELIKEIKAVKKA